MSIALWVDDERPMPSDYNTHVKTAAEAIALIETGTVVKLSLDHDLGDDRAGTGYDVALVIELLAYEGKIPALRTEVHSANPVGRERMEAALRNAARYWEELP